MKIAKINMDPHDNQRFEVHGKSSVKYHLKASHVVEAKRWFWTLNNAIQWAKDEAKEEERMRKQEEETLKHRKAEQADKSGHLYLEPLDRVNTSNSIHDDRSTRNRPHFYDSSLSASRLTLLEPSTAAASTADEAEFSPSDMRRPSVMTDNGKARSHIDGSVGDDNTVDDGEFADDASYQSIKPVGRDAFNITAHSISLQLDLLMQVAVAFKAEQTSHPDLAIGDPTVMQAIASYDAAVQSLRGLVSDLLKISKDRDAYWQYRLSREANMRRLWEESMTHIAKEQAALEGKIGEAEDKRRRAKKALREVLRNAESSDGRPLTAGGQTRITVSNEVVDEIKREEAELSMAGPELTAAKPKTNTIDFADLSESEPEDQDEFYDAMDASNVEVVNSMHTAPEASAASVKEDAHDDGPRNAKMKDVEIAFTGYEDPPRQRLKLDMDNRPKISLWVSGS